MHYDINVSKKGHHYFATSSRSIRDKDVMEEVYKDLKSKYPESEGFDISVHYTVKQGKEVDTSHLDTELAATAASTKPVLPDQYTGTFTTSTLGKVMCRTKTGEVFNALDVRGWGHLTGKGGGLGMSEDEACAAQDAFEHWVVAALNQYRDGDDSATEVAKPQQVPDLILMSEDSVTEAPSSQEDAEGDKLVTKVTPTNKAFLLNGTTIVAACVLGEAITQYMDYVSMELHELESVVELEGEQLDQRIEYATTDGDAVPTVHTIRTALEAMDRDGETFSVLADSE